MSGILLLAGMNAWGSPHVVGYQRFHGDKPSFEGGALLFSELGCANCHGGSDIVIPRSGPNLVNLGSRADRDWVRKFLQSPEEGRKGSTMPSMVHDLAGDETEAVVAYLGSLGKGLKFRVERHANVERGSALYHEKGCVACHHPTRDYLGPKARGDQFDSDLAIAYPNLREKTSLAALHHFLMQPSVFRPDGRMPHITLDKQEAMDIAAHLLDFHPSDPREAKSLEPWPKARPELVAQGMKLVRKQNCAACHSLPDLEPAPLVPIGKPATNEGCLSAESQTGLPFYDLAAGQRESLLAFLSHTEDESHHELTFAAMNCFACHERDGVGGPTPETNPYFVGLESLGDSGRLPPPLTGIGHKLLPQSMEHVLVGLEGSRIRPYLKTQMPVYGRHAAAMTEWLQEIDARKVAAKADPLLSEPSAEVLKSGRKLLGIHGGVNCITCHNWGGRKSLGIPALDISNLDRRLRYDWFHDYLLNPASYRPESLMPPLWPDGQSAIPDVLNGNSERQIEAIWTFIAKGEGIPEGFADRSGGPFELVPKDRPIIQRTFFNKTGTKAILVGFPGAVHLAFDGARGAPSILWRGPFFDAYDTWFTRAAPFGDPLSEEIYEFEGQPVARRFGGYRLDKEGNPTFLLREGDRDLEETYRVEDGQMIRIVRWEKGGEPEMTHPKGVEKTLTREKNSLHVCYHWK